MIISASSTEVDSVKKTAPACTAKDAWVGELSNLLTGFAMAFDDFERSRNGICEFILASDVPGLCGAQQTEAVIDAWLQSKCDLFASQVSMGTDLAISCTEIGGRVALSGDINHGNGVRRATIFELVAQALKLFNVDSFYDSLLKAQSVLFENGCRAASKVIGRKLGLVMYQENSERNSLAIKCVKGCMVLEQRSYSPYWHERARELEELGKHAVLFEKESGVTGVSRLIGLCEDEERRHHEDVGVPSRTRVCVENAGVAVFFKGKIQFQIQPDLFAALLGFVKQYTRSELHKTITVGVK